MRRPGAELTGASERDPARVAEADHPHDAERVGAAAAGAKLAPQPIVVDVERAEQVADPVAAESGTPEDGIAAAIPCQSPPATTCRAVCRWRIPANAQTARASSGRL